MTPQQYHLIEGQKYREAIIRRLAEYDEQEEARKAAALKTVLKDSGVLIPKRYRKDRDSWRGVTYECKDFSVSISRRKEGAGKAPPEINRLREHRKVICNTFSTAAMNRFASFVKLKYGKDASLAVIKKAHLEWLDLLACPC